MCLQNWQNLTDEKTGPFIFVFIFICCCSVAKLCLILCNPMDCRTPGLPAPHYLLVYLYIYIYIHKLLLYLCEKVSHSVVSDSVTSGTVVLQLLCPWGFPGNIGVGCHFLLQGIFPAQGLNPDLLHCRQILYCLSHIYSHIYIHKWYLFGDHNFSRSCQLHLLFRRKMDPSNIVTTLFSVWSKR